VKPAEGDVMAGSGSVGYTVVCEMGLMTNGSRYALSVSRVLPPAAVSLARRREAAR
jgi:hypothetical protein